MLISLSRQTNLNSYRPSDFIGLIVLSNAAFFGNSDTLISNHIPSYLLKLAFIVELSLRTNRTPDIGNSQLFMHAEAQLPYSQEPTTQNC
jgi:hypothetical protein